MQRERQERAQPANDALRKLDLFEKRNPPRFRGGYDPDGAQAWLREMEKIFRALQCDDADKVTFATYVLSDDAEHWWDGMSKRYEAERTPVTWTLFQERFLEKYFPEDVRVKKQMEFLSLTQGSMTVGEYASKFEELSRYYPLYQNLPDDGPRCAKFVNGLRPGIKKVVRMQEIHHFPTLVNRCRIFEEDLKEEISKAQSYGPHRHQRRGFDKKKPYQRFSRH